MHLDEERIERLRHGELPPDAARAAREHVAVCEACRRLLEEAEREESEVRALLHAVDHPAPPIGAGAVVERAEAGALAPRGPAAWLPRAAAIFVAVGIFGAAYALPGSPVRKWVHAFVEQLGGRPELPAPAPAPREPTGVSGIAVLPGEKLVIQLTPAPAPDGRIFVSLVDGPEVQVSASPGAATFTSKADLLRIDMQNRSASFEIRVPRTAPWVEIQLGGNRAFLKEGSRVTTQGATTAAGGYLFLGAAPEP